MLSRGSLQSSAVIHRRSTRSGVTVSFWVSLFPVTCSLSSAQTGRQKALSSRRVPALLFLVLIIRQRAAKGIFHAQDDFDVAFIQRRELRICVFGIRLVPVQRSKIALQQARLEWAS